MKNLFLLLFITASLFSGCKKDSPDDNSKNPNNNPALFHNWQLTERLEHNPNGVETTDTVIGVTWNISTTQVCKTEYINYNCYSYVYNNPNVTINNIDVYTVDKLNATDLWLRDNSSGSGKYYVYKFIRI